MEFHPNYHFSGQKEGEEVIVVLHRHWFNILINFMYIITMLIILLGGYFILPAMFPILSEDRFAAIFDLVENFGLMLIFILTFLVWIDYYFDIWIITNERIVNVSQNGLFNREISELRIEKIQDITTEVRGMISTFLNYGDVYVQTAGERERFLMSNIPDPYAIKDLITSLQQKEDDKEKTDLGDIIRKELHKDEI